MSVPSWVKSMEAGRHKHRCPRCGHVWEHEDACSGNDAAHQCPVPGCGGEQFERDWSDRPAAFVSCLAPGRIEQ